ncbi:MAG TPA: ABC transporter permease subunit [Ktedonobacteraceae bacterium]|nr:ABC transporter permease subunit [Ktedonobacteraceae bacterium]
MGLLLITRFTIQEAFHRWLLLAMLLLNLLLLAVFALLLNSAYTGVAAHAADHSNPQLYLLEFDLSIGILSVWAAYLLSGALTIVLTIGMTSMEIEAGTFSVIVSKPLHRAEIIFGKWLGYALILSIYTAMLVFTFLGLIYWRTGYFPENALPALGMLELSTLVLLALTTLGSTLFPTLVNGAIAIMLFIGAPLASFVQLISTTPGETAQNVTTLVNLVIPTDALWHGASYYLIPSFVFSALQGQDFLNGLNTPFTSIHPLSPALFAWAILYCIVLPIIGAVRFQRRDL